MKVTRFAFLYVIQQDQATASALVEQQSYSLHLHLYGKGTSLVNTFWVNSDFAAHWFHYLLHNCESQTKSFTVNFCRSLKLSKASE